MFLQKRSSIGCDAVNVSQAAVVLRYVFKKQTEGLGKRQRSSSIPDDSPDGKRTRAAGDSDALLKSVAQLEQSNQVCLLLNHIRTA